MTNKEITSVALKVFAIYVLVKTILTSAPLFVRLFTSHNYRPVEGTALAVIVGIIALLLLIGIALGIWKLANNITKDTTNTVPQDTKQNITEEFILSVLGLYLCFIGIQSLIVISTSAYTQLSSGVSSNGISPESISYMAANTLQVIIGISLIIKAHGWSVVLRKLREAGLSEKPSNN